MYSPAEISGKEVKEKENKALIKKSLSDCGAGRSILIDNENEIIAGNGVYEQAQRLKMPTKIVETNGKELIVIKRTDLKTSDQKRKQLAVMDNTTSDSSEFDIEMLEANFNSDSLGDLGINSLSDYLDDTKAEKTSKNEKEYDEFGNPEAEEDGEQYDGSQRVIICYQKKDKEKLEELLGKEITKIVYKIEEFNEND